MIFNTIPFNAGLYNGSPLSAATIPTDLVVFDGFSLSDGSSIFIRELKDSAPYREVVEGDIPRGNGVYINGDFWRKKPIRVEGWIEASTSTLLETAMDTLRKKLAPRNKKLRITRNGVTRQYMATWMNPEDLFEDRERTDITVCSFRALFESHTPFATDTDYTSVYDAITTSPSNVQIENTGTIDADVIVYLNFISASSVTVVNIQRINPSTGATLEEIEYSGSVSAGDIMEFNGEESFVKKAGSEVAYTGSFLTLPAGGNTIKITITGTSFSVYATVKTKFAYL